MPDHFSDAVRVVDFHGVDTDKFPGRQSQPGAGAAISLERGSGVSITSSRAAPGTRVFLQLHNVKDRRAFADYDLGAACSSIARGLFLSFRASLIIIDALWVPFETACRQGRSVSCNVTPKCDRARRRLASRSRRA
jgi:hypothetical protein